MEINRDGESIYLVEQNDHLAQEIAVHGYLLLAGRAVLTGEIDEINISDLVKRAYLGGCKIHVHTRNPCYR